MEYSNYVTFKSGNHCGWIGKWKLVTKPDSFHHPCTGIATWHTIIL